jgi:hypothetical protein
MIITADIILKYPFAVSPRRITDELEILIGLDMAEQARKEGHRKAVPPTLASNASDAADRRAEQEADVFRALMAGDRTAPQIVARTRFERHTVQNALARMRADGRILRGRRDREDMAQEYSINPSYSPTQGQCDPAQPGNPTGTRSDVTTAAPLTGPGALNPLPANGGM